MINLERIERALNTLEVYFQRAFQMRLLNHFSMNASTNRFVNRCRCVGIVLHDRILLEREGYEDKTNTQSGESKLTP